MSRAVFLRPLSSRVVSEAPSGSQFVPISRTGVQRPTVGFQARVRFRVEGPFSADVSRFTFGHSKPQLLEHVRQHNQALEFCVMALDVSEVSRPVLSSSRQRTEEVSFHKGPVSIWQFAEVMAVVKRTREAVRSSAFGCELGPRILDVRSPSYAISAILALPWCMDGDSCNRSDGVLVQTVVCQQCL